MCQNERMVWEDKPNDILSPEFVIEMTEWEQREWVKAMRGFHEMQRIVQTRVNAAKGTNAIQ